ILSLNIASEIHPLEEKALPSFFNGKLENRTRELYMEIRNSIMKKFHENPKTQIEEKDLSEISVGELDAKKEVMEFLDYWGLINYHPLPEADTVNSAGDTEEAAKVNSLIQKLYEFDAEQLCSPTVPRSSFATPAVPYRLPESIIIDESAQPDGPSVEYHCNSCAADCSRKRYHCQKQENDDKMEIDKENGESQDTKETKDQKADNDQPSSSPMEISKSEDNNPEDNNQENGVNIAVKALREAFDAVGSLSSLDEKLCFADAGNPVMAMAAFLTRLVKPNIATATARTSLKSVSNGGTGMQLSARHSFLLEDPADETKKADDTDRVNQEEEKEGTNVTENENKTEKQSVSNERKVDTVSDEKKEDTVSDEKKEDAVSNEKKEDTVTAEVTASKKGRNAATRRKGGASKKDKDPVTEKPVVIEETNKQTDKVENSSDSKKEPEDTADGGPELGLVVSESTEAPKDEEMAEKTESPPSTLANNTPNSGDTEAKDSKDVNNKPLDTKDDPVMHKLTRAAVTAISAAAVKAKFLADQEEDQIRQLATALVEKQLHKLETKLTFFTEMDGVVSRAREQLERSKQRLYQERAQIIAARLGMSGAASSRPMAYPGQRPPNPMAMTPQRPPLSRPMMGATPPFSNPMGPTSVAGNPAQISSNQAMK
ncbi:hypothetical protein M8C21_033743, partial [Ambrosia artemisiifolia]